MEENSFYSIDRLLEFGLGMTMAQQMIQVMNNTMNQMRIPGSIQSMPNIQLQSVYVVVEGAAAGPLTERAFLQFVTDKKVSKDSLAWMPGMSQWQPIEQIPTILKMIALTPPPIPANL